MRAARTPSASSATRSVTADTVFFVARPWASSESFTALDDRRSDHDAVGGAADGAGLRGSLHAEADRHRQCGVPLDSFHRFADLGRRRARPCR